LLKTNKFTIVLKRIVLSHHNIFHKNNVIFFIEMFVDNEFNPVTKFKNNTLSTNSPRFKNRKITSGNP